MGFLNNAEKFIHLSGSFVVFFLSVCLFQGCNRAEPPSGKKLCLSLAMDPATLDPRKARDLYSITLIKMLFEGLARVGQDGNTELALAKEIEVSEDGLIYTIRLHPSFWSDGYPLSAQDFLESWKMILDPKFPTDIAYQLYPLKNARKARLGEVAVQEIGVRALDSLTLIVELERPLSYFKELLSLPAFFPMPFHVLSQNGKEISVSNGPFILSSWNAADRLVLAKNDRYWQADSVLLPSVEFQIASPSTSLQMYEQGILDWAGSPLSTLPADALEDLKYSGQLQVSPFLGTYFYRVNTDPLIKGKPNLLASSDFRRRLFHAIDREAIVTHIMQGSHLPAYSLVPPSMGLPSDSVEGVKGSSVALQEPLTILYAQMDRHASIAQAVQKQWEKMLGIQVQIEAVEPKTFFQRVSKRDYQIAAGSWTADFNDPINFLEVFKCKDAGTNNTGWENEQYIELLERSDVCKSKEERMILLGKAQEILINQMPVIPVFHFSLNFVKSPKISGVVLSPTGLIDLRWARFDSGVNEAEK